MPTKVHNMDQARQKKLFGSLSRFERVRPRPPKPAAPPGLRAQAELHVGPGMVPMGLTLLDSTPTCYVECSHWIFLVPPLHLHRTTPRNTRLAPRTAAGTRDSPITRTQRHG